MVQSLALHFLSFPKKNETKQKIEIHFMFLFSLSNSGTTIQPVYPSAIYSLASHVVQDAVPSALPTRPSLYHVNSLSYLGC